MNDKPLVVFIGSLGFLLWAFGWEYIATFFLLSLVITKTVYPKAIL